MANPRRKKSTQNNTSKEERGFLASVDDAVSGIVDSVRNNTENNRQQMNEGYARMGGGMNPAAYVGKRNEETVPAAADAKTRELIARGILDESGRPIPLEQRPMSPESVAPASSEAPAPKAEAPDPAEMQKLFKTVMGSSFDPKSRMDQAKMRAMQDFYTTSGGMNGRSPTRFALDYYKTLK